MKNSNKSLAKNVIIAIIVVIVVIAIVFISNIPYQLQNDRNNTRKSEVGFIGDAFLNYINKHSDFPENIPELSNEDPIKGCNYFLDKVDNGCMNAFDKSLKNFLNTDYFNSIDDSHKKEYYIALSKDRKYLFVINNAIESSGQKINPFYYRQF